MFVLDPPKITDNKALLHWGRTKFFVTACELIPGMLISLRDDVLPTYKACVEISGTHFSGFMHCDAPEPLKSKVVEWAEALCLSERYFYYPKATKKSRANVSPSPDLVSFPLDFDNWVLSLASLTLRKWMTTPETLERLEVGLFGGYSWLSLELEPPPTYHAGDSVNEYVKRTRAYANSINREYESRGYKRRAEKEQPEHFRWLVRSHIEGVKDKDIAEEHSLRTGESLEISAISKGRHRTAKAIGLKL